MSIIENWVLLLNRSIDILELKKGVHVCFVMGMTGVLLGPKVWTNPTLSFSVIKWVENVNWSLFIVSSFETLYGGQFTLSTQLIKPNYLVVLSHQCSTIVSIVSDLGVYQWNIWLFFSPSMKPLLFHGFAGSMIG